MNLNKTIANFIFAFIIVGACAYGAFRFTMEKAFVNPYPIFCDLVAEKIYLDDATIEDWKQTCLSRSKLVKPTSRRENIINDMNNVADTLQTSHLQVFDPNQVKSIWAGEVQETGIDGDFVDSQFVIFNVQPSSPAEKAGIKKGDIVITINGEQPSSWTAQTEAGDYKLHRHNDDFVVTLKLGAFTRDDKPHLEKIKRTEVLTVSSMRAEYFSEKDLANIAKSIAGKSTVILDLRGNSGGNFVAGLRLLSLFICKPTEIGRLVKPRAPDKPFADMPNDLDDEKQLQILEKHRGLVLKTFETSMCYNGRVKVLVNHKTASAAEMVAQALKELRGAAIAGGASRGELLVGVWYPFDELGTGVQISIPEAIYLSRKGQKVEGRGVQVDKVLSYHLKEMQSGLDSWIEQLVE